MKESGKEINSWEKYSEYYPSTDTNNIRVPESCCNHVTVNSRIQCRKNPYDEGYNMIGCVEKMETRFHENRQNITIAGAVILVFMVSN